MSILRIRDDEGKVHEILAFKGEKGDPGPKGDTPPINEIVQLVLQSLPVYRGEIVE